MLKLLNKLVLGECSQCKRTTMVRMRAVNGTEEESHTCVMCVPVDSTDMGYKRLVVKKQLATALH